MYAKRLSGWCCLAGLLLFGCGIGDDNLRCRDFCDKARQCNRALTDVEWDACVEECRDVGHSDDAIDCVLARDCSEGSFDDLVTSCYLNPYAPEEE